MSRPSFILLALVLALSVLPAACGGEAGGGAAGSSTPTGSPTATASGTASGTPTATPSILYGGYLMAARTRIDIAGGAPVHSASVQAAFYVPFEIGSGVAGAPDTCTTPEPTPTPTATPTPIASRDAGPSMTLEGGSGTINLARAQSGSFLYYAPTPAPVPTSALPANASFTVSWPGGPDVAGASHASAVTLPAALELTAPASEAPLSGPVTVTWTGAPADEVWLSLSTYDAGTGTSGSLFCRAQDDGSFTIPSGQVATLPSGTGTLAVTRMRIRELLLADDSTLYAYGYWQHFRPIQRP